MPLLNLFMQEGKRIEKVCSNGYYLRKQRLMLFHWIWRLGTTYSTQNLQIQDTLNMNSLLPDSILLSEDMQPNSGHQKNKITSI